MLIRPFEPRDRPALRQVLDQTPEFSPDETAIALELADEVIEKPATTYRAIAAVDGERFLGWACFGHTPMTAATFDLYWIVVANDARGLGVGRALHADILARVGADGGRRLRIETSTREGYGATLGFYDALGYERVGLIRDFYGPADDLVTSVIEIDTSGAP